MSALKNLILREVRGRRETLVGTSLRDPELVGFDASVNEGETWVIDVEVGGNRVLQKVPVKANANGTRFYAQSGQTVALRRNAQGRFDVVGPADRVAGVLTTTPYNLNTQAAGATTQSGFTFERVSYDFYQGTVFMSGYPNVTFSGNLILRSAGDFTSAGDGFTNGMAIRIDNATLNPGPIDRNIVTVTATIIQVDGAALVTEGPISGVAIAQQATSKFDDGSTVYPLTRIIDNSTGLPV